VKKSPSTICSRRSGTARLSIRERPLLVIGVIAAVDREDLAELQFFGALQRGELTPEQVHDDVGPPHPLRRLAARLDAPIRRPAGRSRATSRNGQGARRMGERHPDIVLILDRPEWPGPGSVQSTVGGVLTALTGSTFPLEIGMFSEPGAVAETTVRRPSGRRLEA
jgi:hypothetical protein